ncbi:MAG: NAD(+) synthase [Oscillospiraceae bacterium]|nr:NAD(+) synthase [Oscillospiraceae bacterium]
MRDYAIETKKRIEFIRGVIKSAGAAGVVFGNSGGKDCALAGILCKMACGNTVGLIMPCGSARNYGADKDDAITLAEQFNIETRTVDLTGVKTALAREVGGVTELNDTALMNIAPRLRMAALYAVAASENRLVAGTGNRSERHMGYFTKWGDGACDFNPIADLTVTEVYEFLRYLNAPASIIEKAPSAGLFEGQTDEAEMGVTYRSIDEFLLTGTVNGHDKAIIERFHKSSGHKREMPKTYLMQN